MSSSDDNSDWSNFARPGEERLRVRRERHQRTYGRRPRIRPRHRPAIIYLRPDVSSSSSSTFQPVSPRERRVIMAAPSVTPPQRPATPPSPIRTPSPFISYRYRDPVPEPNNVDGRDRLIQQLLEQQRQQRQRLQQLEFELDEATDENAVLRDRVIVLERENQMFRELHQQDLLRADEQQLMIRALQRELAEAKNEASRIILSDSDHLEEVSMDSPISPIVQPESPGVAPEGPDASPMPGTSGTQVSPPRGKKRRSSSDDDNGTAEKRARPAPPFLRPSLSPIPGPSNAMTPPRGRPSSPWLDSLRLLPPASSSSTSSASSLPASSTSSSSVSSGDPHSPRPPVGPPSPPSPEDPPSPPPPADPASPRRSASPTPPWRNGLHRYDLRTQIPRANYNEDEYYEGLDVDWDSLI